MTNTTVLPMLPKCPFLFAGHKSEPSFSQVRVVAGIEIHPNWLAGEKAGVLGNGHDLAVIKINKPSEKTPIEIQKKTHRIVDALSFVGLGRQSENSGFASNLKIAKMSVLSRAHCGTVYDTTFHRSILCTDAASEFCGGDEGGPLIDTTSKGNKLVAIAHLKDPSDICGNSDFPGLYADVRQSRRWIMKTVKKFSEDS